jgi:predicted nucleic acid-binding protein
VANIKSTKRIKSIKNIKLVEPTEIKGINKLRGSRVYFDVNPIIYFIEQNTQFAELVTPVFEMIGDGSILAFTSELSLTEVLIKPIRDNRIQVIQTHKELLLDPELFTLISPNQDTFLLAAQLGGKLSMRTPDAIHMACAIESKCKYFITNDKGIKSTGDVIVIQVGDL